jgi:hypothetical protein
MNVPEVICIKYIPLENRDKLICFFCVFIFSCEYITFPVEFKILSE